MLNSNNQCLAVTRSKSKSKPEETEPIKDQAHTNTIEDQNLKQSYLQNKNFYNCLKFINTFHDSSDKLTEYNCRQNNKIINEIMFTSNDSILLMNNNIFNIDNNLAYLKMDGNFTFYGTILNSITKQISYQDLFDCLNGIFTFLTNKQIKVCSFIKNLNSLYNLEYVKFKQICQYLLENLDLKMNILLDNTIKLYKSGDVKQALFEAHDNLMGGHKGVKKTLLKLKNKFYWKNMTNDVKNYVKNCEKCQRNKILRNTRMPLEITTTARKPGQRWSIDIVGPLNQSYNGFQYILTLQCDLSRYVVAIPLKNQETDTIARAFVENVILKYGCPEQLLSDNGPNFASQLMKRVCKLLNIKKIQTSPYHPESNGALERSHRVLKEYLRNYVNKNLDDWDSYIPFAIFSYNTSVHSGTNYTPHELLYGTPAVLPSNIFAPSQNITYNFDDYYFELRHKLNDAHKFARENLIKSKETSKKYFDTKVNILTLKEGDKVLLLDSTSKKLAPKYTGPYEVIEIVSNTNSKIKIKNKNKIVHNNRLKKFHELIN